MAFGKANNKPFFLSKLAGSEPLFVPSQLGKKPAMRIGDHLQAPTSTHLAREQAAGFPLRGNVFCNEFQPTLQFLATTLQIR